MVVFCDVGDARFLISLTSEYYMCVVCICIYIYIYMCVCVVCWYGCVSFDN